jgi:hypothetical protein
MLFVIFLVSVGALQLWMGVLRHQCVSEDDETVLEGRLCSEYFTGRQCPKGYRCKLDGNNPDFGATSLDDFGYSFISMLRVTTLDTWSGLMYYVQDAYSIYVIPYFYIAVIIMGFIVSQLAFVVMNEALGDAMAEDAEEEGKPKRENAENSAVFIVQPLSVESVAQEIEEEGAPCSVCFASECVGYLASGLMLCLCRYSKSYRSSPLQ